MPLVDAVNEIDWRNEPRSIPLLEPAAWGHTMLGVLLAVSVLTSHLHDPTLFNQLSPSGGIHNALGVGGALIGGTLVELFGASALLLAWLVARLPFLTRMAAGNLQAGVIRKAYYAVLLTWMVAVLAELVQARHAPEFDTDWLWYNHGYLGEITAYWLEHSIGPVAGIALCLAVAMFATFRIIEALNPWPLFRTLFQVAKLLLHLPLAPFAAAGFFLQAPRTSVRVAPSLHLPSKPSRSTLETELHAVVSSVPPADSPLDSEPQALSYSIGAFRRSNAVASRRFAAS